VAGQPTELHFSWHKAAPLPSYSMQLATMKGSTLRWIICSIKLVDCFPLKGCMKQVVDSGLYGDFVDKSADNSLIQDGL